MFDKLKRLFVVEDETSEKRSLKKAASDPQVSSQVTSPSRSNAPSNITGTPKDKFTNILFGAIEANDLEGFDYLEYKEAFAMAQTMGATPQKLVDSIQHYKNVLAKEQSKFGQALENQRAKQIDGQELKINQLQQGIDAKKKQLEAIQKQIAVDEESLIESKKGLDGAATRINETKANFIASYQMIVGQLDQDVEKIKTYLK